MGNHDNQAHRYTAQGQSSTARLAARAAHRANEKAPTAIVIGGGPSAVRVGVGVLEAAAPIREAARNVAAILALAVASLSGTSAERLTIAAWVVLLATYVVDIVLMARCGVAQARAKRAAASSPTTQGGLRG